MKSCRPSNAMVSRKEFSAIKGRSSEKTVKRVEKIDKREDRNLAKRYGVKYKG